MSNSSSSTLPWLLFSPCKSLNPCKSPSSCKSLSSLGDSLGDSLGEKEKEAAVNKNKNRSTRNEQRKAISELSRCWSLMFIWKTLAVFLLTVSTTTVNARSIYTSTGYSPEED